MGNNPSKQLMGGHPMSLPNPSTPAQKQPQQQEPQQEKSKNPSSQKANQASSTPSAGMGIGNATNFPYEEDYSKPEYKKLKKKVEGAIERGFLTPELENWMGLFASEDKLYALFGVQNWEERLKKNQGFALNQNEIETEDLGGRKVDFDTSNNPISVKVKLLISGTVNLISKLGGKFWFRIEYGPFHFALQIGDKIIDWRDSSLIYPRDLSSGDPHLALEVGTIPLNTSQIQNVCSVVRQWNVEKLYSTGDCNCQHFVEEALKELGFPLIFDPLGHFGRYIQRLKSGNPEKVVEFDTLQQSFDVRGKMVKLDLDENFYTIVVDREDVIDDQGALKKKKPKTVTGFLDQNTSNEIASSATRSATVNIAKANLTFVLRRTLSKERSSLEVRVEQMPATGGSNFGASSLQRSGIPGVVLHRATFQMTRTEHNFATHADLDRFVWSKAQLRGGFDREFGRINFAKREKELWLMLKAYDRAFRLAYHTLMNRKGDFMAAAGNDPAELDKKKKEFAKLLSGVAPLRHNDGQEDEDEDEDAYEDEDDENCPFPYEDQSLHPKRRTK